MAKASSKYTTGTPFPAILQKLITVVTETSSLIIFINWSHKLKQNVKMSIMIDFTN